MAHAGSPLASLLVALVALGACGGTSEDAPPNMPPAGATTGGDGTTFNHDNSAINIWDYIDYGNRGGYVNPKVDALIDRIVVTINADQQIQLQRQLLQEQMGDLATMPLFWDINVVPVLASVQGLDTTIWNIFHWDKA